MKRSKGFVYLWLLFSIALTGVGLLAIGDVHRVAVQRDRERELLSIGRQFSTALDRYYDAQSLGAPVTAGAGMGTIDPRRLPMTLDVLLLDPRFPEIHRHLRKVFVDPMTGQADWGLVIEQGRIVGIHSVSKQAPLKRAGFDAGQEIFAGAGSYADWIFRSARLPAPPALNPSTAR